MNLFAINCKSLTSRARVSLLWASMVFLSSVHNVHPTTKKNIIASTIGMMFLVMQKGVTKPRLLTSEPGEHMFGIMRMLQREFTVKEMDDLVARINRRMTAVSAGNLSTSRDKRSKGYAATFESFNKACSSTPTAGGGGIVPIINNALAEGGIASAIWERGEMINQIQFVNEPIQELLSKKLQCQGVDICNLAYFDFESPQLKEFAIEVTDIFQSTKKDDEAYLTFFEPEDFDDEDIACNDIMEDNDEVLSESQKKVMFECLEDLKKMDMSKKAAPSEETNTTNGDDSIEDADSDADLIARTVADELGKELITDGSEDEEVEGSDASLSSQLLGKLSDIMATNFDQNGKWAQEIINLILEAMQMMDMKKREQGSVTFDRKAKSLHQRYFQLKSKPKPAAGIEENCSVVERGDVVILNPSSEGEYFIVMGCFNKTYNKWFLMDQSQNDETKLAKAEKGFRFHLRKIRFVASLNAYSFVEVSDSKNQDDIFKQVNGNEIYQIAGKRSNYF